MLVHKLLSFILLASTQRVRLILSFEAEFISLVPRIALYKSFLTATECDDLISLAKQHQTFNNEGNFSSVYLDIFPKLPSFAQSIEKRIGAVTGYPPHPDEEPLNIHCIRGGGFTETTAVDYGRECVQSGDKNATSCGLSVNSVHHDKVQKEYSSATVLVYLSDISDGSGGTVFPCMTRYAEGTFPAGQPNTDCESAFRQHGRWFDGIDAVEYGNFKKHAAASDLHHSMEEVLLAAHYGCLFDQTTKPEWILRPAIKTVAKKGDAIVFFHDDMDLTADHQAWHAGCLPKIDEKWTLQKFKELPNRLRKSADAVRVQGQGSAPTPPAGNRVNKDNNEL